MNPEIKIVPCLIPYKLITHSRVPKYTADIIIVLNRDVFTIGSADSTDFVIKNPIVSRIHAIFTRHKDEWHVSDYNSTIGVYVNEVKLEARKATRLKHSDTVCLGEKTASRELFFMFKFLSDGSGERYRGPSGDDKMKKENERLEKELKRVQDELSQQKRKAEKTLKRRLKQKEEEFEKKMAKVKEKVLTLLEFKSESGRRRQDEQEDEENDSFDSDSD